MKKVFFIIKILVINVLVIFSVYAAESQYFHDAKKLFDEKNLKDSKFLFEKDIVFNTRSEMSYLYLAKIFEINENNDDQEKNLNTVLLLNPKNEEALYLLMKLKIKQSNFSKVEQLLEKFKLVCVSYCEKNSEIEKELKGLSPDK